MGTPADRIAQRRAQLLAQGGQSTGSGFGGSSYADPTAAVASRRAQLLAAGGQSVTPPAGPSSTASGAALRGLGQGLTAEFGDELGAGIQATIQRVANALPEGALEWAGISNAAPQDPLDVYRDAREGNRAQLAADRAQHGGAALAGNLAGGTVLGLAVPGSGTYGQAIGLGAATGLGNSEVDVTRGDVQGAALDAAIGAGLGAAGKAVGDRVVSGVGGVAAPVRDWLLRKAGAGKQAAADLAGAQAKDLVGKNVQQARSAAGSAASRARNTIENIEGIDLPVENARRTVGEAKTMLQEQLGAVDDAIEAAIAKARAMGVDPADMAPGRQGAFLSPGSKLDKAQKAAQQVRNLQAAREDIANSAQALSNRADDEILPDTAGELRAAQAALRSDPRLLDLKQNVLKNATNDFPEVAAEAVAKRNAYQQALGSQSSDEAALAERLLSGAEAKEQAMQRVQRYAAPLAGTLFGGGAGFGVGVLSGADASESAVLGLAGAGARPAIRSIQNLVKQPAVQNAAWSTLERLAQTAPQAFGKYAGAVTAALARGPEALRALDKVLRDTSTEWRQMREQQEKVAQQRQ